MFVVDVKILGRCPIMCVEFGRVPLRLDDLNVGTDSTERPVGEKLIDCPIKERVEEFVRRRVARAYAVSLYPVLDPYR